MKTLLRLFSVAALATVAIQAVCPARADTFGSGSNTFTIDFVNIYNAGNAKDDGAGGGIYSSQAGRVPYNYRIGTNEIAQEALTKASLNGLTTNVRAGAWTGNRPAANMSWYEAAAFVNWLNTTTGHHAAYNLTWTGSAWTMTLWSSDEAWKIAGENRYRHKDAYYFLPSEDEWYKAGYHKNDGVTGNYWDYATASNSVPDGIDFSGDSAFDAVFYDGYNQGQPNAVNNVGLPSPYGTYGQNGNVWEWMEGALDGSNDSPSEARAARGGYYIGEALYFRPDVPYLQFPTDFGVGVGFRVASAIDTDGDGILDWAETGTGIYVSPENTGTSWTNFDSDGDGLSDGQEVKTYLSNPNVRDTDGDGYGDGFEVSTGFDPNSAASTPDVVSSIRTAVEYRFNAANGISYRIEASTDLVGWGTVETNIVGAGGVITRFYSIEGQTRRYFRSRRN